MATEPAVSEGERTREEAYALYVERYGSLSMVIDAALVVDGVLAGRTVEADHVRYGAVLFTKNLVHAIALRNMSPRLDARRQLWDVASPAVMVRAIAETYCMFRYLAVEPATEGDAKFRLRLYEFHRRNKQCKMMRRFGIVDQRLTQAECKRDDAKAELEGDMAFQSQTPHDRKRQLNGERAMHRTLEDIAANAGINRDVWGTQYMHLTQFAHALPMAVAHLAALRGDSPGAPSTVGTTLESAAGYLGKQILDLEKLFPGCTSALTKDQRFVVEVESAVLEGIRPGADEEDA